MSNARSRLTLLALGVAAASLGAAGPASPATAQAGFLGAWELDLTRMPANYGPPPKRVVYTFEDAGAGKWRTTIDIAAPDGRVRHVAVEYRRDGLAAQGQGDRDEGDSAAFSSPAPNVLVMSIAKDGNLASVRTYALSADGGEMTESAADVDPMGAPFVRNFHYKRIG